jgi:hypothetical protein
MITAYALSGGRLERAALGPSGEPPANAVWLDLLAPSKEEEAAVQAFAGLDVRPEEMQEIGFHRLYRGGDAHFMTAPVIHHRYDAARGDADHLHPDADVADRPTRPSRWNSSAARAQIGWCRRRSHLVGLVEPSSTAS